MFNDCPLQSNTTQLTATRTSKRQFDFIFTEQIGAFEHTKIN